MLRQAFLLLLPVPYRYLKDMALLNKEARIGLLVTISLFVFFAGFYFLKGANLFSGENEYYVYYDDVQGLQPSASVMVKGLSVGRVSKISLNEDGKVQVTISVKKKIKVAKGTVAKLMSADLLGTKAISLDIPQTTEVTEDGATLAGKVEGGLLDNLSVELSPLIQDIRHVVASLDTVMSGVNNILGPDTRSRLSNSVASLDVTMKNFSELAKKLNAESNALASVIRNANSITGNLAASNEHITNVLKNADNISGQLANAPIEQAVKDIQSTIAQLKGIADKVNNSQGSLGMLVNDKQLVTDLSEALKTLNALMADVNAHPSRYINVTIFGRKNKDTH